MESKKINQLATELTPALSDLTIIGDPSTGISKKITLSQMASLFTGTVEEYPNLASFPLVGTADTIYIALDTNVLYRWDTTLTSYVELSPNIINSLVFSDANGFDGNISLVGSVATLTITTALTTGSVPFIGASGALSQDNANLFFDDTNNRLGIGTNAPTTAIDVFGSGIIGRLNGTSTNNTFLGFGSAGSNKWSIGNVQSDHRFRIYNEATTSELVSVLQTGEFGIGIANPTTKFHIDGGASALIANLDANVSVAKSISFRSDNSARINIEVAGTESGSNAGANLFINRYTDAGALIDTALQITRSSGLTTLKELNIASSTNTYFQFNTTNSTGAYGTFEVSGSVYGDIGYGTQLFTGGGNSFALNARDSRSLILGTNQAARLTILSTGLVGIGNTSPSYNLDVAGTGRFTGQLIASTVNGTTSAIFQNTGIQNSNGIELRGGTGGTAVNWKIEKDNTINNTLQITPSTINGGTLFSTPVISITSNGNLNLALTTNAFQANGYQVAKYSYFGYSTGYPGILIGSTGSQSLFFNVDISANLSGAFGGSGNEYIWRNTGSFKTPNAANTAYNSLLEWNSTGDLGIGNSGFSSTKLTITGKSNTSSDYSLVCNNNSNNNIFLVRNDGIITCRSSAGDTLGVINSSTSTTSVSIYSELGVNTNNTSSFHFVGAQSGFGNRIMIYGNGNIVNSNNSYGAISDIKLKENIIDSNDKLEKLLKVRIVNYNLIGDEHKQIGVIAQELEQIFPSMIDETEDFEEVEITDKKGNISKEKQFLGTKTKSVKYSVFIPILIKAIQELKAEIDILKAK